MSSLLLTRLFLQVLMTIFAVAIILEWPAVRGYFDSIQLSEIVFDSIIFVSLSLLFAFIFWSIRKIDSVLHFPPASAYILQRLSGFITFCTFLFKPFLAKEAPELTSQNSAIAQENASDTAPAMMPPGEKREIELLRSIVKFGDVTVKQVMQPRTKVVAADFRADYHALLEIVRVSGFSRLPIFDEDLDNVTGILYVKDLVPHLEKNAQFEWQTLVRTDVMLVPESKHVTELLQAFKQEKIHLAIVIDEYGGTSGIVTLEDILEEITGEIRDEFDEEQDIRYRKIDNYTYIFDAQTLLNDLCRIINVPAATFDSIRGAADTLAGLTLELKGDIPKSAEQIEWQDYTFTIISADQRRVKQVKIAIKK
jgi:CBS domain containing-hemolysin-like protein